MRFGIRFGKLKEPIARIEEPDSIRGRRSRIAGKHLRIPRRSLARTALENRATICRRESGIRIDGQNAAAPTQDRRACVKRRGQMTHAGLAAMAVAASLGPA